MPVVWLKPFRASFGNKPIFDSLLASAGGKGKAWALRQWELETINAMGWTEARWIKLTIGERYRKVCAHKLKDWFVSLETEEQIKKMRQKSGNG